MSDIKLQPGGAVSWNDFMRQNEIVRSWSADVQKKLKQSARQFTRGKSGMVTRKTPGGGQRDEDKLVRSIRRRVMYKHGISQGCSFRIERHGVFVHKGVGRGYEIVSGSMVVRRTAKSPPGDRIRTAKDWFNPIIEANVPQLADDVARVNADAAVNALRLRIH